MRATGLTACLWYVSGGLAACTFSHPLFNMLWNAPALCHNASWNQKDALFDFKIRDASILVSDIGPMQTQISGSGICDIVLFTVF